MEDRVKELMDRIRGTASACADACADTARVAGRKAGQIVDVAKLNVQLFDLNGVVITGLKLDQLIKADDPSPFPALTQVEVFGSSKL